MRLYSTENISGLCLYVRVMYVMKHAWPRLRGGATAARPRPIGMWPNYVFYMLELCTGTGDY